MSWDHHTLSSQQLALRGGSGRFITPPEVGGTIHNMELTESGTLRAVVGPAQYHPTAYTDNGGTVPAATTYTTPHSGIFHCLLEGGKRDVLLAHFKGAIYVHQGWRPRWYRLIGPSGAPNAEYDYEFPEDDGRVSFGTQFVATPNGVVIIPQGGRALFYDGTTVAPLGFDRPPGPPTPWGPNSGLPTLGAVADDLGDAANTGGYAHNGRRNNAVMGDGRLGTIRNTVIDIATGKKSNSLGGILEAGQWRAALQFMDKWGNLSPQSPRSLPAYVSKEDNLSKNRAKDEDETSDKLRVQLAWASLDTGPDHVYYRQLLRTKDLLNSGIPGMFNVPPNAAGDSQTVATIHNVTQTMYTDNIPDEWLLQKAADPVPVPIFRLAALAFGRLWVANTVNSPGLVRPSEPFFWGTFPKNQEIFPDANGGEVTGLLPVASGLLVFTDSSTFLITQDDSGQQFKTATLSTTVGCVAPKSAQVMLNGAAVWLGQDGFYGWTGEGMPKPISKDIQDSEIYRINKSWSRQACAAVDPKMGEYRCWVPVDGRQRNERCLVFDGAGWKSRDDVYAQAVCVKKDHTQYMLVLGHEPINGLDSVWALDHEALGATGASPTTRTSYVETSWLRNTRSHRPGSVVKATLWLRETSSGTLNVQVMRDYREYPKMDAVGVEPTLYPNQDTPALWGTVLLGATRDDDLRAITSAEDGLVEYFTRRRPFWTKVDLNVPSAEAFRLRLESSGDWEFIALIFDEQDRHAGGAKIPQGV